MLSYFIYHSYSIATLQYKENSNDQVVIGCVADSTGEVLFPNTVTTIESLQNCKDSIKTLHFQESSEITTIESSSFSEASLEFVNLSECVKLTILNSSLFKNCKYLKTIILPPNLLSIEASCFYGDENLTSIDLPDSLVTISGFVFSNSHLTTINISHDSKLAKIDSDCFSNSKLKSIFIPKFVNYISISAFMSTPYLENILVDPKNTNYKSDSESLYSGTDNSTLFRVVTSYSGEFIVPNYVRNINFYCFCYCTKITFVQFHGNMMVIDQGAFNNCINLKNISFLSNPDYIRIYSSAFSDITNTININFHGHFNPISDSSSTHVFPEGSNLYVSSRTILSEDCIPFFGEKSMNVYITSKAKIADAMTYNVIKQIAIAIIHLKPMQNFTYNQIRFARILNLIPSLK